MRVLGIIASSDDPSSRIRIRQYKKWFTKEGEQLDDVFYTPLKEAEPSEFSTELSKISNINKWRIWNAQKQLARLPLLVRQYNYDILWQSRLLIPEVFKIEQFYRKPFVFDIDDAIWMNEGESHVAKAFKKADIVFAGNDYLAEYASRYNKSTIIIPTTVDTDVFSPQIMDQEEFIVGWIGTASNFPYLESIKKPLLEFISKSSTTKLMIVSSHPPSFLPFDDQKIVFRKWSQEGENELVNDFTIGVMPLPDNDWTRGKCGYKLLQYMACSKPFIASPTGVNKIFIEKSQGGLSAGSDDEWLLKLQELSTDKDLFKSLSSKGRSFVESHYSAKGWAPIIINHMKKLL